jgi:hypothetical protein
MKLPFSRNLDGLRDQRRQPVEHDSLKTLFSPTCAAHHRIEKATAQWQEQIPGRIRVLKEASHGSMMGADFQNSLARTHRLGDCGGLDGCLVTLVISFPACLCLE